jgi:hypothetical protein
MLIMAATEAEVTVDGLNSALNDLIKAADATDTLGKGGFVSHNRPGAGGGDANGVENSGHYDEDGKRGGNRGSMADAGGLDDMMIGKLAAAGYDASQIAAFSEALSGAARDEEDGEDGEDEEDEEMEGHMRALHGAMKAYKKDNGSMKGFTFPGFGGKAKKSGNAGEPLVKSFDRFRQDPDISEALDVSKYLEAMTARTAEARCGLLVIDLRSGEVAHWVRLEGMVSELDGVTVLPRVGRPMAMRFKTSEIHRTRTIGDEGRL